MVDKIAKQIIECFKSEHKILICGNGGSACEASHFAGELVGKFYFKRRALPAISLNDPGVITAIGNDYSFDDVFGRQVEAFGKPGDILITLSTSGNSKNVINAQVKAVDLGMKVICFPTNSELNTDTPLTQEKHLKLIHQICEKVEEAFL